MKLTDYEKGLKGEAVQMAMQVLCDLGEYYGAEKFVEIVACWIASSGSAFRFL